MYICVWGCRNLCTSCNISFKVYSNANFFIILHTPTHVYETEVWKKRHEHRKKTHTLNKADKRHPKSLHYTAMMRWTANHRQKGARHSLRTNNKLVTTSMLKVKVKHKVVFVRVIEAYRDYRSTGPVILNLGSSWISSVAFTFWPLYLQRNNLQ